MKSLHWIILGCAIAAVTLSVALFGWPKNLNEAGGFATFMAGILTPASLMLLVLTLQRQEASQTQATRDGFLALQVQSLIALIEDDRSILDSMAANYRATGKKSQAFTPIQHRYRKRVEKLNALLGKELDLPDLAES